jgi:hypothetical protein
MNTSIPRQRVLFACALLCAAAGVLHAQVNVTTYHNDVARTGQNIQETILTPANVNSSQFGKLFSVPVDGVVYAQPLYLSGVNVAGGTHNVLYIETEHDSVYAIDADSGAVYAQVSLIPAGGSTQNSSSDIGCGDLVPEVGITGTPVIDPATGTLYVIASSKVNGSFFQYLHALDVATLSEKLGGPVNIQASVPGTGYDSSGGVVTFNARLENQRAALLLENGHVIAGWSSHCDIDPWHGWVISYGAATLAQEAAFNTSPNDGRNGVWMSGGGAAADASGNIYFATGNGSWNGTSDYGDSIVKLGPPANGSFPVLDYFTPYNQGTLDADDTDLASGGLVLLPALPSGQQLLAQQGKQGTIYLLDINKLGGYCPNLNLNPPCTNSDPNAVAEIMGASPGIWGSPAYWNGNLYWTGANDNIKAYSFNATNPHFISTSPTSVSAQIFAFSAPTPVISANGNANAILWALDGSADDSTCDGGGSACLGLYAYDATNLANLLYTSAQAANNRDSPGVAVKFEKPIVANGKVYVGTQSSVTAYGLLVNALPSAATPTLSPAPGAYTSAQAITLTDTTPGASIYYTTNGSTPTLGSTLYSAPFQASSTEVIQAIAIASGYSVSTPASGTYFFSLPPVVNLAPDYTVDGIGKYGKVPVNGGLDGNGDAYASNLLHSPISWGGSTFTLGAAGAADAVTSTTIALPSGNYTTLNLVGTGVNGAQLNQVFVVAYSDGSTTSFTQSLSDWSSPQKFPGESQAARTAYRIGPTGKSQTGPYYLYGYSFGIDSSKTVVSITLPNNPDVVILGAAVSNTPLNDAAGFTSSAGLNFVGARRLGDALELTNGKGSENHAVWLAAPVNVQNFSTDFSFQITPAGAGTADGLTFTIQNAGPAAVGSNGAGLGYAGIGSSVAVKFDLYNDAGEGSDSTGFYLNGATPTVPSIDMTASGVSLQSGDVLHAHLTYDGTTLTLTLSDTVTGATFTASQAINIPATVGGNMAYVGFTASTGKAAAVQEILSWSFSGGLTAVVNDPAGFSTTNGLTLNGVSLAGATLQLTNGAGNEANAVWTAAPVNVQKFDTDFDFLEIDASADGFTFTLQNAGADVVGQTGGALGYAGLGSSVAVKFDLYNNSGEGTDSTGFYTDGAYPSVPFLDMTASGVNLHGTDLLHAHINYDGTTLTLTLTDTVTGASFTAAQAINIPATVGANTAYAGFTAGTGGLSAIQQIVNWTYVVN